MKRAIRLLWIVPALLLSASLLKATLPQTTIGTWTSAASLSQPRANASAVMLSDGRILIAGGDGASGALQSAELFDPAGSVSSAAPMNVPRSGHLAVVLSDGRVLVGGGTTSGGGTTNSAEIYDPTADSWTLTNPMISARANATAALLQDGTVLIAGGDNSGNASNTIEIFNPWNGNFSFAGTLSSPRTRHAMAVLQDGRVLIVGGSDGTNPLSSCDIFDPSSGNITAGPNLTTARYGHSATTLLDGRVAIIGGETTGQNGTVELATAEIYDPAAGSFAASGTALATARQGHQAFLLPNNNNVLIVGGTTGGTSNPQPVGTSEVYSGWQDAFIATGANVTPRSSAIGSAIKQDGLLLAAGGNDASGNTLASTELYAFPTVKTDASDYAPGTVVTITGSGWKPGETVTLTLFESPLLDTHPQMTTVADVNGNIINSQFSPDVHDINIRFYLTAVGSQSSLQAQNTFTDAAGDTTSITVSCAPNPVTVNTAAICTATVNNVNSPAPTNGFPQGSVTFSFSGTGTFSPASGQCAVAQIGATNNASCAVSLTPTVVANGNVKGNFNSADQNKWKNDSSPNVALTVAAPTCTAASVTTQPTGQAISYGQNATFTAAASGTPIPTVQWQVSSNGGSTWTNVANGGVVSGATTGTLTLTAPPVSFSANQYRAVFTNTCAGTQTATSSAATLTVSSKALTVTGITVADHVYDGATTATLNLASAALQGVIAGDTVSLNSSGYAATFASKSVANGIGVTVTGLGLSGASAGNYTLTQPTGLTGNITPKPVTATLTASDKVYDGNNTEPSASLHCALAPGSAVGTDDVACTATSGMFNTAQVLTANQVTATAALSGTTAGNYSLTSNAVTATAHITAVMLTGSIIGNPSKPYDGTTAAVLAPSNFSLAGLVAGESITVTQTVGNYNSKDVITAATITATLAAGNFTAGGGTLLTNYVLPTTASGAGHITAVTLAAVITGNPSKAYDGTAAATLTSGDYQITGLVAGESITVTQTVGSYNSKDVITAATITATLAAGNFTAGAGTLLTNYVLPTTASGAGHITAVTLTASIVGNPTKPYDGNTTATLTPANFSLSGLVAGESITLTQTSGTYNTQDVLSANVVTVSLVSGNFTAGTGTLLSNYVLPSTASGAAQITPKTLSASIVGPPTKTYDGNTNATLTSANFLLSGLVGTESFTVTKNSGTYNTKDVATATTVTANLAPADFSAGSGTLASNYALPTTASGPGQITAKTVTASIIGNPTKMYDGSTAATFTSGNFSLSGLVGGESFTVTKTSGLYNSKDVLTAATVSASLSAADFTPGSGTLAGNYNLPTSASGAGKITPRPLVVSAHGIDKQYDGTAVATVTLTDDRISGDVFTDDYSMAAFADKNVATGKPVSVTGISIAGADASDYSLTNTTANTTANITARPLTVSATGVNKIYDGTTAATVNLADDRVSGDVFTASYANAVFNNKNVGTGKSVTISGISISGTDAGNYALSDTTASTAADITVRTLTITATGSNKVYDGSRNATVTLADNRITGDLFTDTYTSASFADKNVANGKVVNVSGISISGADAGNYSFNSTASATADITVRSLTVAAAGVNKVYDGTTAATVILSDDRVAGDSLIDNYSSATFADKNVANGKPVGVSGISISGADAGNYALSNATASTSANITLRLLTVTATGINKIYDGIVTATVTLSDDRVAGDSLTDSYSSANFADKNVGSGKSVGVSGISISGADANNYLLANTTASAIANITLRPLTIMAHGVDREYDGTTGVTVTLSDDRLNGDVFIDSYTGASFADKNASSSKAVSVSGISISGTDAGNYSFNTSASTTANITRRPITVTAVTDTKVYDGTTTSAGVPSSPGIAAGDAANFTQAFDTKNAGPRTLTPAGSVNDGNAGNNYVVTFMTANGTISQRPVTVTADPKTKMYGDNDPPFTYQITGGSLIAGDSFSGALTRVSGENVSTYAIQQGTLTLGNNYAISYAGVSLNITPAPLTITPDGGKTKIIGTVFTAFTVSISGLKFNDAVTVAYASTGAPAAAGVGSYDITVSGYTFTTGLASNYSPTLNKALGGLQVSYSTAACLGDYGHQILQPINFDGTSVFKQKSTVPAKFRVCDAGGNSIGTPGVVSSFRLVQTQAGTVQSVVDEAVDSTTPDAAFRWDPSAQQWIFNMNTKSMAANVTYYYKVTLNDGSTIAFMFGLK